MARAKITNEERQKSLTDLKSGYISLKEDADVYTLSRRKGNTGGMDLDVYIVGKDNTIWRITWSVAAVTGFDYNEEADAIRMSGSGYDKGYEIVSRLSKAVFGDETKLRHRWL